VLEGQTERKRKKKKDEEISNYNCIIDQRIFPTGIKPEYYFRPSKIKPATSFRPEPV
jgi:hypothetical protein